MNSTAARLSSETLIVGRFYGIKQTEIRFESG